MTFSRDDTKLVKGFAIILMLYHHLFAYPAERLQPGVSYTPLLTFTTVDSAMLLGLFGKLCVALFLFLGGYGTWASYHSRLAKQLASQSHTELAANMALPYSPISKFTVAKVKSLYIPYLKVFVIVVPIALIVGDPYVSATFTSLFWNLTGLNITYNGEWWFFTDYLILLAAFPLIESLFGRRRSAFTVDLLAICIWNAAILWLIPSIAQLEWAIGFTNSLIWGKLYETMHWSPCFIMGCLFARWDILSRIKNRLAGHYLACLAALLSLPTLVCLRFKLGVGELYDFLYAPVICIALSVLATTRVGATLGRPLKAIGKHSTNIWLTHSFFCYHWCQAFIYLPKWSPLVFLLLLGVSYAFSLLIDWVWSQLTKAFAIANKRLGYAPR